MRTLVLTLMAALVSGGLFAQNSSTASRPEPVVNGTPNIIYKPDTLLYLTDRYKVPANSKVEKLLLAMEGFTIDKDGQLMHQGKPVQFVRVNGKHHVGMTVNGVIEALPVTVVANIEVIDDYSRTANLSFKGGDPDKLLNINTKPGHVVDLRSFGSAEAPRETRPYMIDTLRDVFGRRRFRGTDQSRIEDRTESARYITRQMDRLQYDIAHQGRDVDDYGDQIPHFVMQPPPYTIWPVRNAKVVSAKTDTVRKK